MGNVILAYIAGYGAGDGHYYVRIPEYNMYSPSVDAYMISPTPGGGLKGAPKIPQDTEVLVAQVAGTYYILGFPQFRGPMLHNSFFPVRPTEEGDTLISDSGGRSFGLTSTGSFFVYLTTYANFVLNAITRKLTMTLANLRMNFTAGSLEYEYDGQKKTSQARAMIYKSLEGAVPGLPPQDRMQVKFGKLEDDSHMVEGYIKQEHNVAKLPAYKTIFKLGKQANGNWLDIATQVGAIAASAIKYSVIMDDKGMAEFNIKDASKEIDIKTSLADGIEIKVNKDKAVITVDMEGNVTFKLTDAAKMYLGGKTNAQQLVTKSWIDMIFKNHMHPTAAPGPPSIPIPIPLPVVADSKTNPYTFTTLGE